ncbi:MAG: hypothetical protein V3V18_07060 [Methylococcales bacterium]
MIKIIIALVLMQSLTAQADVVQHIRFCAGKFCAAAPPFSLSQQLEMNKRFREGSLVAAPTMSSSVSGDEQSKYSRIVENTQKKDFSG